ncbi:MAG TPA: DUF4349 domain-containing protein [Streptosporangiaceae bacterium]|nr:DUF4349 domain-containing protein [Streptosporangiaceae bacterium]
MTHAVLARRGALSGAILIAGCLLLAACSNGGSSSASSASEPGAQGGLAAPAGIASGAASNGAATASGSRTAGRTTLTAGLAPTSESIIYTASMTLRSANVAAAARQIASIVVAAGGYTADEHVVSGTPGKTGEMISITLKIPVPAYQSVLARLSSPSLGKQLAMQQQATDVTQEVANVNSLVTSEQDAITALQGLLKQAASVTGLLQVQQQISADESTLNSLLAQQSALNHQTSYATVTMTLQSPAVKVSHKHATTRRGFGAGLAAGWRALKHAAAAAATALGAALPFLVVIAVLGGIGYAGRRRFMRRRAGPTPTE